MRGEGKEEEESLKTRKKEQERKKERKLNIILSPLGYIYTLAVIIQNRHKEALCSKQQEMFCPEQFIWWKSSSHRGPICAVRHLSIALTYH